MPIIEKRTWPMSQQALFDLGKERVRKFCELNNIPIPEVKSISKSNWCVSACAYYRPDTDTMKKWTSTGINICLDLCQKPCSTLSSNYRNWSWPGSTTDREPYGVICHELGHHCDWLTGKNKGDYYSEYSEDVMLESMEEPISSYCPNPAEWFAEMFRVFVTNHGLLKQLRPTTYGILLERWKPIGTDNWKVVLGDNVPDRVVKALLNKGAKDSYAR